MENSERKPDLILVCYVCRRVTDEDRKPHGFTLFGEFEHVSHVVCLDCRPEEHARIMREMEECLSRAEPIRPVYVENEAEEMARIMGKVALPWNGASNA